MKIIFLTEHSCVIYCVKLIVIDKMSKLYIVIAISIIWKFNRKSQNKNIQKL